MATFQEDLRKLLPFERFQNPPPVVGVIRLAGVISAGMPTWRGGGLSLQALAGPIEKAFKLSHLKAVALVINSPGGSAVQSSLISRRIRELADEKKVPVIAFVEDVAASGGYWLACAADEIIVDESSIVGSIGVIFASFGFQDLIARVGVERRIHVAGEKKSSLDPFRPEDQDDVVRLRAVQDEIHEAFKDLVRARRTGKLTVPEDELFSGEYWTGKTALRLGLVDDIGHIRTVMRARYGERVKLVGVGRRQGWLRRRLIPSSSGPEAWMHGVMRSVEERGLWARYGL